MPVAIKTEGPTDMLAVMSLTDLPADASVFCNAFGAMENPDNTDWIQDEVTDFDVWVIHDADVPGQQGATEVPREGGPSRPGWAPSLARKAKSCRNVVLPYPVAESKGKDLRDWLNEGNTFADLQALAESMPLIEPIEPLQPEVNESPDDPHRLARLNLKRYRDEFGRHLIYWNEGWYAWKSGQYVHITKDHLCNRIGASIKLEFDRIWFEDNDKYEKWLKSDKYDEAKDKGPPTVRKVTTQLVNNVYLASKSQCALPSRVKIDSWINRDSDDWHVSCKNGIVNLSAVIRASEDDDLSTMLEPHSPDWFSTTKLPYEFDPQAQCPQWSKFVTEVFNGDEESILALQKWFGYLLSPDKSLEKIMFIIGQKRSGKGTIARTMQAVLGRENIATPTLSDLSKDFGLESLVGKTSAMVMDARVSQRDDEIRVTENLLTISGGDSVDIRRKHISSLTGFNLNVRFTLFSNLVPKLKDHSAAFVSRCIFLAMPNSYLGREDPKLKDRLLTELPGILNWAIAGRFILNEDGRIEQPDLGRILLDEMKSIMSPVLQFVEERCEFRRGASVETCELFGEWERWCEENDVSFPGNTQAFSRKLKAINPAIATKQVRDSMGRRRLYIGIELNEETDATDGYLEG